MTLLEGDVADLLPGIDVYALNNRHSAMDQVVVVNTPDDVFVDVGDLASRESQILGIPGEVDHYLWQTSAGSEMLTMLTYPWIMEKAQGDIKRVIIRHDLTYGNSKTPVAQSGNCVRYQLR